MWSIENSGTPYARYSDRGAPEGAVVTLRESGYSCEGGDVLPDYIIYDELRRRRQQDEDERPRPQLEIPRYVPNWPESEADDESEEEDETDRGVIIIQM